MTYMPLQVATLLALDRLGATAVLYPATTARQWLESSSTELALAEMLSSTEELESMLASGASASVERVVVPRAENSRVVLFTSGTSGPPKPAVHTWESLSAAVSHHERHRGRRWLLSYDLFQFAGLQVMLQSLLTGGRLCAPDARDPSHVARCLENDREVYLVDKALWLALQAELTPVTLVTVVDRQGVVSLWPLRVGVLRLSFPEHADGAGRRHPYVRPLDADARAEVERQVFDALQFAGVLL